MTPSQVLLDTDVLSAVMRRHHVALLHAQSYLQTYQHFAFSIITRYEVLRGLRAKQANAQLAAFNRFCAVNQVLPLTDAIVVRASELYAHLHQRGTLIGDADILIAATALVHDLTVGTNNAEHFKRIPGLRLANWLT